MSADEDLFGQSRKYRSISFKGEPPLSHRNLRVLDYIEKVQARDPETGDAKFFKHKSGPLAGQPDVTAPIWQWVIKVEIPRTHPHYGHRDILDEYGEEDGVRYLFVGGNMDPAVKSSRFALAQALRKAGVKRVEPDGVIDEFTYIADGPKAPGASRVSNAPKQYRATYIPPQPGASGGATGGTVLERSQARQQEQRAATGTAVMEDDEPAPF